MSEARVERLREAHKSLGTVKLLLGHTDVKIGKAVRGPQSERVLALREQVGRAYQEVEKAERWAHELRALLAGEKHPGGRGRSFASRGHGTSPGGEFDPELSDDA